MHSLIATNIDYKLSFELRSHKPTRFCLLEAQQGCTEGIQEAAVLKLVLGGLQNQMRVPTMSCKCDLPCWYEIGIFMAWRACE
jgi:hypothetical protein